MNTKISFFKNLWVLAALMVVVSCSHTDSLKPFALNEEWYSGELGDKHETGWGVGAGINQGDALSIRSSGAGDITVRDCETVLKTISADKYRGKRIKLSGFVKVKGVKSGAALWMRVDGFTNPLVLDNMINRRVSGNGDWKACELVLQVPGDAVKIVYGGLLEGEGQMWFDGLKLTEVSPSIAITSDYAPDVVQGMAMTGPQYREPCAAHHGYGYVLPHNKISYIRHQAASVKNQ